MPASYRSDYIPPVEALFPEPSSGSERMATWIKAAPQPNRSQRIAFVADLALAHFAATGGDGEHPTTTFVPVLRGGLPFIGSIERLLPGSPIALCVAQRRGDDVDVRLDHLHGSGRIVICDIAAATGKTLAAVADVIRRTASAAPVEAVVPFMTHGAAALVEQAMDRVSCLWSDGAVQQDGTLIGWTYDSGDAAFGIPSLE